MPDFAARLVKGAIDADFADISVIATRSRVAFKDVEQSLGQSIEWVEPDDVSVECALPDILFVGGYHIPAFNALVAKCRAAGIPVVVMFDTNWQGNFRQRVLDPVRHRLFLLKKYDAAFVPGQSSAKYARNMGYPSDRIRMGHYGIDKALFSRGPEMADRSKSFIFVGQFIDRKNVLGLVRAFLRFSDDHPEWTLRLCGSGPQRDEIAPHPSIIVEDFVQPAALSKLFQDSRALILPSLEEHWSLVAMEAAMSGCALGLTSVNGITWELAKPENSIVYEPSSDAAIEAALRQFASWGEDQWQMAQDKSVEIAQDFGPHRFAAEVQGFTQDLLG